MRTVSRNQLACFVVVGYIMLGVALAKSLEYGSSEHPIGMAFSAGPMFAIVTFTISLVMASAARRPINVADLFRVVLWGLVGFGAGVASLSDGYYRHFYPQRADQMHSIGLAVLGVSFGLIVMSFLVFTTPRNYADGSCSQCGYDLQGSNSPVCPECGHDRADEREESAS